MSSGFDGLPEQDFGDDFVFESDSQSLKQILGHQELSPKIHIKSGLTPGKRVPQRINNDMEFFQTKSGAVFWRERIPDQARGCPSSKKKRGLGRTLARNFAPVRINQVATPGHRKRIQTCMTERKDPAMHPPIHRQSISERKAVPLIDKKRRSFLPQPVKSARKELKFDQGDDFQFAKPQDPTIKSKTKEPKSLAKMIMMRESLAGMPRASLTGLFRQSLSMAELDRMFEDDSTESFENLESRLKTPAKKKPVGGSLKPKTPSSDGDSVEAPELKLKTDEETQTNLPEVDEQTQTEASPDERPQTPPLEDVEEYICEIDIEDDEFEDTNNASLLLRRAKSYEHLPPSDQIVVLASSASEEDLRVEPKPNLESDTTDPFLKEAIENLNKHRQEQAALENKLLDIMSKSKKRRENFRAVWGVSPRSINQKRTVKTVLTVQNFKVSDDVPDQKSDDEISDVPDDFNEKKDDEVVEEESQDENELEVSISTDLFHQFIDANFSPPKPDELHNFSDMNVTTTNTFSLDEIAKSLEADFKLSRQKDVSNEKQEEESLETPEPFIEDNPANDEPDENLEPVDMDLELGDLPFTTENEEPVEKDPRRKSRKSVRFLNATPDHSATPMVQIDIPLKLANNSQANISVNESRLCFSGGLMQTPLRSVHPEANPTTPMILRDISNKAQRELASLYDDIESPHFEDED